MIEGDGPTYIKRGVLRKISTNLNALRTDEVRGIFFCPPCPSLRFTLFGRAIDPRQKTRVVSTSMVRYAELTEFGFRFETLNSTYELHVYDLELASPTAVDERFM